MSRREFLQLAHVYDPEKHGIGGWYASEKLDGMRAYWDGGWTRGRLTSEVPFANTFKDFRRINPVRSTGLWSRYAKPIAAPDWWLDGLPDFPLDGELYLGIGRFQELISIAKRFVDVDEDAWKNVEYRVFDLPSNYTFLAPGKINNPQWTATFDDMRDLAPPHHGPINFHKVVHQLSYGKVSLGTGPAFWEPQTRLPMQTSVAQDIVAGMLSMATYNGSEGLMLRKGESIWTPQRTWDMLKVKLWHDSEALVTGYTWGKGKLKGLMGALTVLWKGKTFELSGFTNTERRLLNSNPGIFEEYTPGAVASENIRNLSFPRGTEVTFRYRELTKDGIPKEARYWRSA